MSGLITESGANANILLQDACDRGRGSTSWLVAGLPGQPWLQRGSCPLLLCCSAIAFAYVHRLSELFYATVRCLEQITAVLRSCSCWSPQKLFTTRGRQRYGQRTATSSFCCCSQLCQHHGSSCVPQLWTSQRAAAGACCQTQLRPWAVSLCSLQHQN
jgi:hypothetical protein